MPDDAFTATEYDFQIASAASWKATTPDKLNEAAYLSSWSKRLVDVIGASALLIFALPLIGFACLLIVVTSPGGPIFSQRRHGRDKVPFFVLKLRSMRVAADKGFRQAVPCDPRVTRIGRIIRKTSIDELPQLVNVLKGDMSLIGPRPHAVEHDEQFAPKFFGYDARYRARPGITGLAPISGARGETPTVRHMRQRLELDLRYISDASFKLDCIIMVRTARELLLSPIDNDVY